jgi:hypothetical protein
VPDAGAVAVVADDAAVEVAVVVEVVLGPGDAADERRGLAGRPCKDRGRTPIEADRRCAR